MRFDMRAFGHREAQGPKVSSRYRKVLWILLFVVLDLLILTIHSSYPIRLSDEVAVYFQIPVLFWALILTLTVLWWLLFSRARSPFQIMLGVALFYFILYSPNLFFISPYQQTDKSISTFISIIADSSHIDESAITMNDYFEWPIFFVFSKTLINITGVSISQLLHVGILSFNMMVPLFLLLYFKKSGENGEHQYSIIPPIVYILIAYMFIVNQFAPQTMALVLFFLVMGLYVKLMDLNTRETSTYLFLFIIAYFTLTFTHPFFFIFALAPIMGDFLSKAIRNRRVPGHVTSIDSRAMVNIIMLLIVIYISGFLYQFFSIENSVQLLIDIIGTTGGETWDSLFSAVGGSSSTSFYPLFFPSLSQYYNIFSWGTKLCLVTFALLFLYLMVRYPRARKEVKSLDIWLILWSGFLYVVGLFSIFLGQRSVQVMVMPVSKAFSAPELRTRLVGAVLALLVICAPVVLLSNNIVNQSMSGAPFMDDVRSNTVGRFADTTVPSADNVLLAESLYPVSNAPYGFYRFTEIDEIDNTSTFEDMNLMIYTPKLNMQIEGYGTEYMAMERNPSLSKVYTMVSSTILYRG
ncbi:MAG: hypothetical protein GXX95_03080 [Methanomassiliicoccus sp.]|nr:hypothetical protein [Methanomassiliicoccus sp.]